MFQDPYSPPALIYPSLCLHLGRPPCSYTSVFRRGFSPYHVLCKFAVPKHMTGLLFIRKNALKLITVRLQWRVKTMGISIGKI